MICILLKEGSGIKPGSVQFTALNPAELQVIDPEVGTLSEAATIAALKSLGDELADALGALRKARENMAAVANRADQMYPKAKPPRP
ncbi:hypothetical protein [Rhodococcus zopfii]|uniref:hypothetical protein n=2 Tax=Rhodococcus zopfii TaxID=43772 RepID=UPI001EE12528|nr:hypothetical protein [Rhodococcus zopfii]